MEKTFTETTESTAAQLSVWQVRNYDPRELSLLGEGTVTIANPALYGFSVPNLNVAEDSSRLTMLASEAVLAREWNTPEEDEAWAHL